MKPAVFRYSRPASLEEALRLLQHDGQDAKVLAGGQSLIPLLNFRLAKPAHLIDINAVPALAHVERVNGSLRIGALTRQRALLGSDLIRRQCPLLAAATEFVGHPAIRNRGTVGGSVAHADPAAEIPLVVATLDGQIMLRSTRGSRVVGHADFFTGPLMTAGRPDELLTEIQIPVPPSRSGWGFHEVARRHGDFALVAAAAVVTLDGAGKVSQASVALGGIGDRPLRASAAERLLAGQEPSDALLAEAARTVTDGVDAAGDNHASADYRRHLARVLARRALTDARRRAQAG